MDQLWSGKLNEPKYAALAAGIALVALAVHFGSSGTTTTTTTTPAKGNNSLFFSFLAFVVVSIVCLRLLQRAQSSSSADSHARDLEHMYGSLVDVGALEGGTPVLEPDMLSMRRVAGAPRFSAAHPEVVWALLQMRPFKRANRGTVAKVLETTEFFFERYYSILQLPLGSDPVRVSHGFQELHDIRGELLNSMTALLYAKPHASEASRNLAKAVDVLKWRSYRAIKTLHNKFGGGELRASSRGAPYAFDPQQHAGDNRFRVHVA